MVVILKLVKLIAQTLQLIEKEIFWLLLYTYSKSS